MKYIHPQPCQIRDLKLEPALMSISHIIRQPLSKSHNSVLQHAVWFPLYEVHCQNSDYKEQTKYIPTD